MRIDPYPIAVDRQVGGTFGPVIGMSAPGDVAEQATGQPQSLRVGAWGRALRLAQRLSGGTEALLRKTNIGLGQGKILLSIPEKYRMLYSDSVERRLMQLGKVLGRKGEVRFT